MKHLFAIALIAILLASCKKNSNQENPYVVGCKAENIYFKDDSTNIETSEVDTFSDVRTKCYMVYTTNTHFAYSTRLELFSPDDNLLMVVSQCSECCDFEGYKFAYDSIGRLKSVASVILSEEKATSDYNQFLLKEMMRLYLEDDSCSKKYEIGRDESGNVVSVGNLYDDYDCSFEYGVYDVDDFWESDLHGGDVYFVVAMKRKDRSNAYGSFVDVYYVDGKIAVEAAYWNDKLIKALIYDKNGRVSSLCGNEMTPLDLVLSYYCNEYECSKPWYFWQE
ncbi:MAG: hypothetical protein MJ002_07435 [Paludibacteraceae bacterium]|nr:hypothetical protein [Paludibacteraceae bacterium]